MSEDDRAPLGSTPPAVSPSAGPPSAPQSHTELPRERVVLTGVSGSAGVAVGRALVLGGGRSAFLRRTVAEDECEAEVQRVRTAARIAQDQIKTVAENMPASSRTAAPVLDAYLLMLSDPMLHDRVERKIRRDRKCAEWAVSEARDDLGRLFAAADHDGADAYIAERVHDVGFVCDRLLRTLVGDTSPPTLGLSEPMILFARDLSPADTAGMAKEPVLGFVTEIGSRTSHTSIMARALEIPSVVGVKDALAEVRTGDRVIVCGLTGTVIVNPSPEDESDADARNLRHRARAERLLGRYSDRGPASTACGQRVRLVANLELPAEADLARKNGAETIGLYRTEFLYVDRADLPSEDEQYEAYRAVVSVFAPEPVTLRTFDIGGDKFASTFQLPPEMNPALGLRAIRLALEKPDVFLVQLRAMVRASMHGPVRIMIPMVSTVGELVRAKALLRRAEAEVRERFGHEVRPIPLGAMIEVPAAAIMADVFARYADFFSLGTNDLVQYSLAIDRTSRTLAHLASPLDPSIVRLARGVVQAAQARAIPLSVCGAMASDPLHASLLVGLGVRELSMESAAIPALREALSRVSLIELETAARTAMAASATEEITSCLADAFASRFEDLAEGLSEN